MTSKIVFTYIFCVMLMSLNLLHAQQRITLYDWSRFFVDKNYIYSYGTKYVNKSFHNRSADGYEHDCNFYLIRYDTSGKKLSETLIDKKRDFTRSSELVKKRRSLYTLLAVINRNPNLNLSYYNHFLVQFDSLGNVTHEFKILDSTYAQFNSIFYGSEYIYVTFIGKKIVCEKYDYNFKLVEKITDPVIISFLYGGRVYETKNGLTCFGPFNNMDELNKKAEKRWLNNLFFEGSNFCVKKLTGVFNNTSKTQIISFLASDVFIESFRDDEKLFCTAYDRTKKRREKLYVYNEKINKLELITDTISSCSKLTYVKALSDKEFILFEYGGVIVDSNNTYHFCPDIIYHIKNNKPVFRTVIEKIDRDNYSQGFKIAGEKLYIYQMNDFGSDIKIKIYDYENEVFLNK